MEGLSRRHESHQSPETAEHKRTAVDPAGSEKHVSGHVSRLRIQQADCFLHFAGGYLQPLNDA